MATIWDIIKIKSIVGVEKVTEEQKNSIISDAVSKWTEMGLSQQQIAYGIAVMGVESAFNPTAQSPTGPYGLGQFSADTWKDAVKEYNTKYGGNLDTNLKNTDADTATQIAVLGAWTSKIWTKAEGYVNAPMFKGYSVEEIAYGLHNQSYYSSKQTVLGFLRDSNFNGYNKSSIKGYFTITYQTANNILGGYYTEYACFSTPQASLLDKIFNPQFQLFTTASTATPPRVDPLILDLDGDGIETIGTKDGAYFDHDGNGFAEQTGWAGSDDGLLVMDRNNDGIINDGKELFGDQTILSNGQRASNGFQALADLDSNADGKIDTNDTAFANLKVWKDIDGDGYSSADELISLSDAGVASINTGYSNSTTVDAQGNEHKQIGSFTRTDGTTAAASDVWFQTDKMYTIANEWLDVPTDIAALPDLQGYGNVYDLQQAREQQAIGNGQGVIGCFNFYFASCQ